MNSDLEHLITLQAQDLELKRLREELAELPRRAAAAEAARARAEAALTAAKTALAKEETLRRSHELDIADRRGKIVRLGKQMETATSAAQITALENEIAFSESTIATLEDEELASLERTDLQEAARAAAARSLETATAAVATERTHAHQTIKRNDALIVSVDAERKELRALIAHTPAGEALLANYDRIARAKGTAVSQALGQKCTACQMVVRPQRWNDLSNRDPNGEFATTIFYCETCGRMLYFDPRQDAPVRWTPGEKLAAATGTALPGGR